jgi:ubiquinone/menaquinone biosynthesis C-methylase UbiE
VSVDNDESVKPTIVYDLYKLPWAFASEASYDRIIDTTGLAMSRKYRDIKFLKELQRVLKEGGTFYGRNGFTFTNSTLRLCDGQQEPEEKYKKLAQPQVITK